MAQLATYFGTDTTDPDACRLEFDGDDDGGNIQWYRCLTHDKLTMGDSWPCEDWGRDTTDQHGAGTCTFATCSECQAEATCDICGEIAPLHTSRWSGEAYRECCGTRFI